MIFCFSGCGNTALVAQQLAEILGECVQMISIHAPRQYNLSAHTRVIWAFPVYSWGMPTEVRSFMREVNLSDLSQETVHFMVATCGDDAGLTDKMWVREVKARGWHPKAAFTVIMPNTYVSLPGFNVDSPELTAKKLAAAPARITHIARAIKCHSGITDVVRGKMAWLKTRIIYPLFMRFLTSPGPFRSTDACTGCGTCSRHCPTSNITIANGRPVWSNRCTMCLGCYHRCPQHCISYGSMTRGKGQYTATTDIGKSIKK